MEPEKEKLDLAKAKLDLEKVRCQVALEVLVKLVPEKARPVK